MSFRQRAAAALRDARLSQAVGTAVERFRAGREQAAADKPDFELLRERARAVRAHTIDHLDYYLAQLAEKVRARGGHVHFAATADDAVAYVTALAKARGVRTAVKSKSMVTEEIGLNKALESIGVETVETDLGEFIIQLHGTTPSHLIAPSLHVPRGEVARLFAQHGGRKVSEDTPSLTAYARAALREKFLAADMGITGCNFAVAETGSIVLVTNEGNGRMVTSLPRIQVSVMGMERVVPTLADLDLMLELLPRSATGQKITSYVSVITGPRREGEADGPEELHLIIVDNGRSNLLGDEQFREALHCIRCGACLNVCPVYREVGGHAYGYVYSGPIGAVITPLLRQGREWSDLAYASSLCGACTDVCPVKIPLHELLIALRDRSVREAQGGPKEAGSAAEAWLFRLWARIMVRPKWYRLALRAARWCQRPWLKDGIIVSAPYPLSEWTRWRALPGVSRRSFRERWAEMRGEAAASAAKGEEVAGSR